VYEVPVGRGRRFLANAPTAVNLFLGGWQASGIVTIATGSPFPLSLATPVSGSNGFTERPNRIGDGTLSSDQRTVSRWFDTSAFAIPAVGIFGDAGRNIVRGPGQSTVDFSLVKDFRFAERYTLQYRAEFYNLFNKPQLGLPNGVLGSAPFGSISSTAGNNRQIQMALKLNF
jgi:hypothetical protein